MPFSPCRDVLDRVSQIVDGEASMVARMRFYGHLAMCTDCRRYYRQFRDVKEAAGVVQPEDLPADFGKVMSFVMERIERDAAE